MTLLQPLPLLKSNQLLRLLLQLLRRRLLQRSQRWSKPKRHRLQRQKLRQSLQQLQRRQQRMAQQASNQPRSNQQRAALRRK